MTQSWDCGKNVGYGDLDSFYKLSEKAANRQIQIVTGEVCKIYKGGFTDTGNFQAQNTFLCEEISRSGCVRVFRKPS